MAVASQFDSREVMKIGQAARFMTSVLSMITKSIKEHEKNVDEKINEKLKNELFKDGEPNADKIIAYLGDKKFKLSDDISVRLLKNYISHELAIAMADSDVGAIRLVENGTGLTALVYHTADEEKIEAALKQIEVSLGSSPVVNDETIRKLNKLRGDISLYEFKDVSFADMKRFQYAASKNGFVINITENKAQSRQKPSELRYNIKVLPSDKEKVQKGLRDIAAFKLKDGSDSFERSCAQHLKATETAASFAVENKPFYVCSASRPDSYIEVTPKGFTVINQQGGIPKEIKSIEGSLLNSMTFNELGNEMFAFENPVVLSAEEFDKNPDERLMTVVGHLETLKQQNEGKAFVHAVTATAISAANTLGIDVYNSKSLSSERFYAAVEKSNISNKGAVLEAIGQIGALPDEMTNRAIQEYQKNLEQLDDKFMEEELFDVEPNINQGVDTRNMPSQEARGD